MPEKGARAGEVWLSVGSCTIGIDLDDSCDQAYSKAEAAVV